VSRTGDAGLSTDSGSGLAYSSDPTTGQRGLTGQFHYGATGAGLLLRGGQDLAAVAALHPWGDELAAAAEVAQHEAGQPVRVEFTVHENRLSIVAVTPARLHGAALLAHVVRLLDDGAITDRDALGMIGPDDLVRALTPAGRVSDLPVLCRGQGVAPGVASGVAVFSAEAAVAAREDGAEPVLILPVTRPQDLPGLLAATAVVTEHGGSTSHAAVVTRGLGRVCVTALRDARVDLEAPCLRPDGGEPVRTGDRVTVDGTAGVVHRGGSQAAGTAQTRTTAQSRVGGAGPAVRRLLAAADRHADLAVRVNADSPADAEAGREAGATGIGLCRIEHMLLGERQSLLASVLTAAGSAATGETLDQLRDILRADFAAMLRAMDGMPVTIRLLDPPRHEFLPDLVELAVAAAVTRAGGDQAALAAARRLHETNPMLGVRGIRLGVLDPRLLEVQLAALVEATALRRRDGGDPRPELLVPMVTLPAEIDLVRDRLAEAYEQLGLAGTAMPVGAMPVGAMIETPRAALVAGDLATRADFLSIGSNDLTALVWGLSRDDAERELVPRYRDLGLVAESPAVAWDGDGVGDLVRRAVTAARRVKPDIGVGICGEHAADPAAVRLLVQLGADYLSCSPARLPAARLTAGRVSAAMRPEAEAG
jgi:pyruvate, orthophosphate dikinase